MDAFGDLLVVQVDSLLYKMFLKSSVDYSINFSSILSQIL